MVTLFAPTFVKLVHSFEPHEHTLCEMRDNDNFHECEVDCPLYKYNFQQYDIKSIHFNIDFCYSNNFDIPSLEYHYFHNHSVLSFSLRGPPTLV